MKGDFHVRFRGNAGVKLPCVTRLAPNPKYDTLDIAVQMLYICTPKLRTVETKLTLRLKKNVIDQAKRYANDHETSLSKLIENYLSAITTDSRSIVKISPLVQSLSGVIKLSENEEAKSQYHEHLSEKYL